VSAHGDWRQQARHPFVQKILWLWVPQREHKYEPVALFIGQITYACYHQIITLKADDSVGLTHILSLCPNEEFLMQNQS